MTLETLQALKDSTGKIIASIVPEFEDENSESPTVGLIKSVPIPSVPQHNIIYFSEYNGLCYDELGEEIPYKVTADNDDLCYAMFLVSKTILNRLLISSLAFIHYTGNLREEIDTAFSSAKSYYPKTPYIAKQQSDIIDIITNSAECTAQLSVRLSKYKMSLDQAKQKAYREYIAGSLYAFKNLIND